MAGLVNAVVSVPDGLAAAALAGVNPVYGLYTSFSAPIAGSALASTQLMQIATTSASALAAGQTIATYPIEQRDDALFLLVILTGLLLAAFGLLGLGRLARFVSHAVMTGFLIGVAAVLILDQLAPLVGGQPEGPNEIVQFVDLLSRPGDFDPATIVIGLLALAIAYGLRRTRVGNFSSVLALVVPAALVALIGWESVDLVADVSPIPQGFPGITVPALELLGPELVLSAFALAVVVAVQGAGVSQSVRNLDGAPVNASRDMLAQGAGNIASGLLSGIPAGGSVGQTALNVSVGGRTRWSGITAGVWMLVVILAAPALVGEVPMSVLAALMIVAGVSAINHREARSIWATGGAARWLIVVTFIGTLVLSIPLAVAAGVALSVVLYTASSAAGVSVRRLVPVTGEHFREVPRPERLDSREVTILDVRGNLFFAGARTLADKLPSPAGAERPAVVIRLRNRGPVGSTLIDVLDTYVEALAAVDGRLYLTGVDGRLDAVLRRVGKLDIGRTVHLMPVDEVLGASTWRAVEEARLWIAAEATPAEVSANPGTPGSREQPDGARENEDR